MTADLTSVRDRYDVAARVERGVAWLDEHDPGWWRVDQPGHGPEGGPIDLDRLDIRSPYRCVLGQRWGKGDAPVDFGEWPRLGFGVDALHRPYGDIMAEFDALTAAWSAVIRDRRSAVANA